MTKGAIPDYSTPKYSAPEYSAPEYSVSEYSVSGTQPAVASHLDRVNNSDDSSRAERAEQDNLVCLVFSDDSVTTADPSVWVDYQL